MRVIILCDNSGKIKSVAFPTPDPSGSLHMEAEGGSVVHELDVDAALIQKEDLQGKKGPEIRKSAYDRLYRMISSETKSQVE